MHQNFAVILQQFIYSKNSFKLLMDDLCTQKILFDDYLAHRPKQLILSNSHRLIAQLNLNTLTHRQVKFDVLNILRCFNEAFNYLFAIRKVLVTDANEAAR